MSQRATESLTTDEVERRLPEEEHFAYLLLRRLGRFTRLETGARIVDVGCAAGTLVLVLRRMGYDAVGVEPDLHARWTAAELARRLGGEIPVLEGQAEKLPLPDASCDLVVASSVLEHVGDLERSLREARRILKPDGALWFYSTSALCPWQHEIRGFPLFGWYPLGLKRRIMRWAVQNRPELVGHTANPALHWFTPRMARRLLKEAGFGRVINRWSLRLPEEGGRAYRLALKFIQTLPPVRFLADVLIPESAYLAKVETG
ncbi:MAG: class I SAM-dependent methyltransferase [bacterium]|nr:class I SAM-dependent methyltransferase [bacterium]